MRTFLWDAPRVTNRCRKMHRSIGQSLAGYDTNESETRPAKMAARTERLKMLITLAILMMMIAPLSSALPAKDELRSDVEAAKMLLVSK